MQARSNRDMCMLIVWVINILLIYIVMLYITGHTSASGGARRWIANCSRSFLTRPLAAISPPHRSCNIHTLSFHCHLMYWSGLLVSHTAQSGLVRPSISVCCCCSVVLLFHLQLSIALSSIGLELLVILISTQTTLDAWSNYFQIAPLRSHLPNPLVWKTAFV